MNGKAKILVIEDERPLALMLVLLLNRVGYAVTVANSGREGIELAARQPFDLITLDVNLPDMRGFEVCHWLKSHTRHTPIIFVTGQPAAENQQLAFELGAADYLEKPFEPSELVFRIAHQINRHQRPATALPTH